MAIQRVYALFQDVSDAERAIGALEDHGINRDLIGIVARRPAEVSEEGRVRTEYTRATEAEGVRQGTLGASYEAQPGVLPAPALASTAAPASAVDTPLNVDAVGKTGITTTTPADAAAGAAVGTGVGLIAGLAVAAAALAIPGVGLILAGGALASALGLAAGTTAAGAAVGGVVGYLRDMGMPEQAASRYADRLVEGDYLLTAMVDTEQYDEVKKLLLKYNAVGVDINVAAAGEQITAVRGADPALASEIQQVPLIPAGVSEVPVSGPFSAPSPTPHIVTQTADGVPLVPARTLDEKDEMIL